MVSNDENIIKILNIDRESSLDDYDEKTDEFIYGIRYEIEILIIEYQLKTTITIELYNNNIEEIHNIIYMNTSGFVKSIYV